MQMYRRMRRISWKDHRTNNSILEKLKPTCCFLAEVKRKKLQYFGHVIQAENLSTRKQKSRKTTDTLDWWYQAVDRKIRCRMCSVCSRQKQLEIRGVRVGDLRSSEMRKDEGKARQGKSIGILYLQNSWFFIISKRVTANAGAKWEECKTNLRFLANKSMHFRNGAR